jgi:glycosyltransferase involved in cell wall biosynthesis
MADSADMVTYFVSECPNTCNLDVPAASKVDSTDNGSFDAVFFNAMKVLITSPSLDENENVSGISTMISNVITSGSEEFVHYVAGRKDGDGFGLKWLVTQVKLPFAFRRAVAAAKPDVLHINTSLEPRAIIRDLVLAKSSGGRPLVMHVHGGRFVQQEFPNAVLASLATTLLKSADRVIVLSDFEAETLQSRINGLNVSVLPNAVATRNFPDGERPWGEKTIVYLGRLDEAKGLSEMVEAARLLSAQGFKFKFACYGTGNDRDEFIRRMTNVLGERFHYGGVIAGDEKIRALMAADVFLMPSRFEGLSLALLESMAAGCIPIVSNRGSMPSVVEDGRNGFLVDPGDITQIVGKLKFLLSEGEKGWDDLRTNARRTIREKYDTEDYSKKLSDIYREVRDRR